jgi:HlyD family secretion protein
VKKGQRLVDLERAIYTAESDRRRAEVANRRIEVTRARAALRTAQIQYERARKLREQGIQAEELYERTSLELENARAGLASAEEGVRQATAALAQSNEDLARTSLHSPIDGRVVQLAAQEGEVVVTGTMNNPGSVIAVIADLSEILVQADVPETEVVKIRLGQAARVQVDAVGDRTYNGRVVEIGSSAVSKASGVAGIRYFKVKVAITDSDDRLRPGMTSQVEILTDVVKDALAVPLQAVVKRVPGKKVRPGDEDEDEDDSAKKNYVFVVTEGKVRQTAVTTGVSSDTDVAITGGLQGGEQIVTGPFRVLKKLEDGSAVQIDSGSKKKSETNASQDEEEKD